MSTEIDFEQLNLYRVTSLSAKRQDAPPQLIYAPSGAQAKVMAAHRIGGTWNEETEVAQVERGPALFVVPEQWVFSTADYLPPERTPVVLECYGGRWDRWAWKVGYRDGNRYWALNADSRLSEVRRWYPLPVVEDTKEGERE